MVAGTTGDAAGADAEDAALEDILAAVDALMTTDTDWADLQWDVADRLHERFLDEGNPADLDEAIRRGRRVVAAQGEGSPAHLHDLALMLWDRTEIAPDVADFREYNRLLEQALVLPSPDAQLTAKCKANLATGLMRGTFTDPSRDDVARAVTLWEEALASGELDPDAAAGVAANLAQALSADGATEADLRRAVAHGRRAVAHPCEDADDAARHAFALARSLASLEAATGEEVLLDEAAGLLRDAVAILGPENPERLGYMAELINVLRQRAQAGDDVAPLDEAVGWARTALEAVTDGDPDWMLVLTSSGAALSDAGHRHGDVDLQQEALRVHRRAIGRSSADPRDRGVTLTNLASACRDCYDHLGDANLLSEGVDAGRRALATLDQPGRHRAAALTALGNLLRDQFVRVGDPALLLEALNLAEEAVQASPEGDPQFAARLTNLATILSDDYDERGDRAQLDRAIALYREALEVPETMLSRRLERLNDLAISLRARHRDSGDRSDLDEAVELASEVIELGEPATLAWAGYASNLGNALAERYERTSDGADLNRAIALFEEALSAAAERPLEASGYATNLGIALAARARDTGSLDDVDQALQKLARSVDLLPPGHPDRSYRLSNLADTFRQRSIMLHNAGVADFAQLDADEAVTILRDAVDQAGVSDARLVPALSNLAEALRWREELAPASVDQREILKVQRRAAQLWGVPPAERFGQSGRWARDAEAAGLEEEAAVAWARAVELTTEVAWAGLSLGERLGLLREMQDVLADALAFAVSTGRVWMALAWADHVRSVLWRQELRLAGLSSSLQDEVGSAGSGRRPGGTESLRMEERLRRERMRSVAHDNREALREAVADPAEYEGCSWPGPVALLVPGAEASFALLLQEGRAPRTIPLPEAAASVVRDRAADLREASAMFGRAGADGPLPELTARHVVFDCLEWLWDAVAEPVLRGLGETPGHRPHLWWSTVGEFALLPVHAAGRHPRNTAQIRPGTTRRATVPDRVISSYAPTLLGPRRANGHRDDVGGRLLCVATDAGAGDLTHLPAEVETLRSVLVGVDRVELLGPDATVGALREAIPQCAYLHIAGHSGPPAPDSLKKGFEVADGVFTLQDLAACRSAAGSLAVLLTCDSAAGDPQSPNQALHVAGAAHLAGFPDVVAATLPVRDSATVEVVTELYSALSRAPGRAAVIVPAALDRAVRSLRLDPATGADPLSWVPFAHYTDGLVRRR